MIADLIDQLQGFMVGLEEKDSKEFQNQYYRDELIKDMLHYRRGMSMPPPLSHYG